MRILLLEDDPEQLEPLHNALTRSGHIVDGVAEGTDARWLIGEKDYDLLILDWMLPGEDGVSICEFYREEGKTSPILMLTAKDTTADKVRGLDAGADDYLVKPVDVEELLARVRALRRRSPLWIGDILEVGDLSLNLDTMSLTRGESSIKLTSQNFQLLEYLMRNQGKVLSRDRLEQALWEWGEEPESNAVASRVKRLRKRLQELEIETWIETAYGVGYRFEIPQN
ncbi:response regulator transcription factor [Phormidium pseudopriestleyi FRX01]|uniref:Response regulator transcription factor n=1 Tax=Phormidium pseudopriestleyi FRX01 TaxID=1759528 RepID=A0ABS3FKY6_9CYAN|nr:response regulator transcription factor [Phormidium pseudopriestleyi]MBO0347649.1 response regulator transcription factor [Phormidium pseudopriestleyi FRX01]